MKKIIFLMIAAIFISGTAHAQAADFARAFYGWYVQKGRPHTMDDVLRQKKDLLSPELYKALKFDREAQAKAVGEIDGIDFDPFLNAQDVASKYEVGAAVSKGETSLVPVYSLWDGKKSQKPDVTAEILCRAAVCQFVNFHYDPDGEPANENLLSILKEMAKDRAKH